MLLLFDDRCEANDCLLGRGRDVVGREEYTIIIYDASNRMNRE